MTTRSLITHDGDEVIVTSNGTPTTTTSVWKTLVAVDYLSVDPTVVNVPLLATVKDLITENGAYWDQNVWRTIISQDEAYSDMTPLLGYVPDQVAPVCGTAMCFAGWTAEAVKADWVVDGDLLRHLGTMGHDGYGAQTPLKRHDLEDFISKVLVRRDWWSKFAPYDDDTHYGWGINMEGTVLAYNHSAIRDSVLARGFTPETHHVVAVSRFAEAVLGIPNDAFGLFEGSNRMSRIERIIAAYTRFGNNPSPELIDYVHDETDPLEYYDADLQDA